MRCCRLMLSPPDGLDAADYFFTASDDDVGGDFYDLFPLSRTTWGFFLGDVAGKGVDAAVVTALIRYTLRAAAVFDDDPVQVLDNLNTVINQEVRDVRNRFSTVIYGKMTRARQRIRCRTCQRGPPAAAAVLCRRRRLLRRHASAARQSASPPDPHFVASRFHLRPGDTLMLYTDGLTEASTGIGTRALRRRGCVAALCEVARSDNGVRHRRGGPSFARRPRLRCRG